MTVTSTQLLSEGLKHHRAGHLGDAEKLYRRTLKIHPKHPDAMALLGTVLCDQGRHGKGVELIRKAAKARPKNPKFRAQLGKVLLSAGRVPQSIEAFRQAVALGPGDASLHYQFGHALLTAVDMDQAIQAFEQAHLLEPGNLDYRYALASSRLRLGELPAQTTHFRALVEAKPESALYQCQLATALRLNNEFDEAQRHYERALELEPGFPEAVGGLAQVYESTGRTDEARRALEACIERGQANFTVIVAFVRICKRQGRPADAVGLITDRLVDPSLTPFHRMTLLFRLGDLYEDMERYDEAWTSYREANAVHEVRWNRSAYEQSFDGLIDAFSPEALATLPRGSVPSESLIFVVGMFRSGTSLTDQILSSHPAVHGAGELPDVQRIAATLHKTMKGSARYPGCLRSITPETLDGIAAAHLEKVCNLRPGARRVSDKNPINYIHLGLIALLFPQARIVHCTRDPRDTCVSCYANSFSPAHAYTQDLGDMAHAYGQYRRLMDHWRQVLDLPMIEVRYEELVTNQEHTTRALLEFCDLEFDPACLRFHESTRVLQTLSKDQIRRPMYTSSIGRHERFAAYLGEWEEGRLPA